MRKRFKVPLIMILILITICSFVFVSFSLFNFQSYGYEVVADYPLTINYTTGYIIDKNNYEDITFSVANSSDEDLLYTVNLVHNYSKNNYEYILESDDYKYSGDFISGALTDSLLIKAGETEYFTLNINYDGTGDFEGEIKIIREISEEMKFYQSIIINNDIIFDKPFTTIGKDIATIDEGLIETSDNNGSVYYFRGNPTNNYVEFADMLWRIVKINSDGTVKLALDTVLDVAKKYYVEDFIFEYSNVYITLNDWYDTYLSHYELNIEETSYCNDFSISNSETNTYGSYNRIVNSYGATFDCVDEDIYLKIGLLTADEVVYAGANIEDENKEFYLYNENTYFTMTSALVKNEVYYPFVIKNGKVDYSMAGTNISYLKPVINIVKNTEVIGEGTLENPYKIKE